MDQGISLVCKRLDWKKFLEKVLESEEKIQEGNERCRLSEIYNEVYILQLCCWMKMLVFLMYFSGYYNIR